MNKLPLKPDKTHNHEHREQASESAYSYNPKPSLFDRASVTGANLGYLGKGYDSAKKCYGIFAIKGDDKPIIVPSAEIGDPSFWKLFNNIGAGIITQASKTKLMKLIEASDVIDTNPPATIITEMGFSPNMKSCVLGNRIYGKQDENSFVYAPKEISELFAMLPQGTLGGWNGTVGTLSIDNSALMTALSFSLTSISQALIGGEQSMLCFVGKPASGKSTIGFVASSLWGSHTDKIQREKYGFGQRLKTTTNQLDYTFYHYSRSFLFLDETRANPHTDKNRGEVLKNLAFSHESSKIKARMTDEAKSYFTPVLLTANKTIIEELGDDLKAIKDTDTAHFDRLIESPLPVNGYGAFKNIHGRDSTGSFCTELKAGALANSGIVVHTLLKRLLSLDDTKKANLVAYLKARQRYFKEKNLAPEHPRLVERFSEIYSAGVLGLQLGVFNWKLLDIYQAVQTTFLDTLELRQTFLPAKFKERQGYVTKILTSFITEHSHDFRVIELDSGLIKGSDNLDEFTGFTREVDDGMEYLFTPSQFNHIFEDVVKKGANLNSIKASLAKDGLILTTKGNLDKERYSIKRTIGKLEDGTVWRENLIVCTQALIDGYLKA